MKIRKNASLEMVAAAAQRKAKGLFLIWSMHDDVRREAGWGADSFAAQSKTTAAWSHYADVRDLADHLTRLAGES